MMRRRVGLALGMALAGGLFGVQTTRADGIFKRLAIGLSEAGFDFQGNHNFLSGGDELTVSRNWTGETLDFGTTELTLTGPMQFQFSTGGRKYQVMDISLNTNNQPLAYTLTTDTGSELTTIDGTFLLDATAKVDMFGWYDLTLDVSSRQDITQDGRYSNDKSENDFDVGPIHIRGNLFGDLLASITDPFFQAAGQDNIFASFSGARQAEQQLSAKAEEVLAKARLGQSLTTEEIAELASITSAAKFLGLRLPDLSILDQVVIEGNPSAAGSAAQVMPEPACLVLVALGAVGLIRRRTRCG